MLYGGTINATFSTRAFSFFCTRRLGYQHYIKDRRSRRFCFAKSYLVLWRQLIDGLFVFYEIWSTLTKRWYYITYQTHNWYMVGERHSFFKIASIYHYSTSNILKNVKVWCDPVQKNHIHQIVRILLRRIRRYRVK